MKGRFAVCGLRFWEKIKTKDKKRFWVTARTKGEGKGEGKKRAGFRFEV